MAQKNPEIKPDLIIDLATIFDQTLSSSKDIYTRFHRSTIFYGQDRNYSGGSQMIYPPEIWDFLSEMYYVTVFYKTYNVNTKEKIHEIMMSKVPMERLNITELDKMTYSPNDNVGRIKKHLAERANPNFAFVTTLQSEVYVDYLRQARVADRRVRGIFTGTKGLNLDDCTVLEDFAADRKSTPLIEASEASIYGDEEYYNQLTSYGYT